MQSATVRLLAGLARLPKEKPPAHFAKAMTAEVLRDRARRRDKMRRRVTVTMALAASVLLMLLAGYYFLPRTNQPGGAKEQIVDNQKPVTPPPKDANQPADTEKPDSRQALIALPDRLADTTRDHARVVMAAASIDGMDKLPVADLPADSSVHEMSSGVSAVTRNTRRAFDFFARELPMPQPGDDKD
jgi:hypothetical protein